MDPEVSTKMTTFLCRIVPNTLLLPRNSYFNLEQVHRQVRKPKLMNKMSKAFIIKGNDLWIPTTEQPLKSF